MPIEQEIQHHPLERHAQLVNAETVRVGDLARIDAQFEAVTLTRFSPVTRKYQIQVSNSRWIAREQHEKVLIIRRWHRPDWHED